MNRQISLENDTFRAVIIGVVTLLHHLLLGLAGIAAGAVIPTGVFLRTILLEALTTTLVFVLATRLLRKQKLLRLPSFSHE